MRRIMTLISGVLCTQEEAWKGCRVRFCKCAQAENKALLSIKLEVLTLRVDANEYSMLGSQLKLWWSMPVIWCVRQHGLRHTSGPSNVWLVLHKDYQGGFLPEYNGGASSSKYTWHLDMCHTSFLMYLRLDLGASQHQTSGEATSGLYVHIICSILSLSLKHISRCRQSYSWRYRSSMLHQKTKNVPYIEFQQRDMHRKAQTSDI